MQTKCLLACADERLLGAIIEDLLIKDDNLELIEIIGTSEAEVFGALDSQHPNVIIFCYKTHDAIPPIITLISNEYPELLTITITSDDNYMHINGKQKILVTQTSDLLSVIHNHY